MNEGQPLQNPELNLTQNEMIIYQRSTKFQPDDGLITVDCSTQVDTNDDFFKEQAIKERKKNRKKSYKKRKKEKQRIQQQSARERLSNLIEEIYAGKTIFEDEKNNIEIYLWHLIGGNKFHDFLNLTIRFHVDVIQKSIINYMESLVNQNRSTNAEESQRFCELLVEKIYHQYMDLRQASKQVEKIINLFMKITGNDVDSLQPHWLDKSTFRFMIQTEQTIKSLLEMCSERIQDKKNDESFHLRVLNEILLPQDSFSNEFQEQEYGFEGSTQVDEEESLERKYILKRKKRRKKKDSEFKANYEDVVKRLSLMNLDDDDRLGCNTSSKWLNSLHGRMLKEK